MYPEQFSFVSSRNGEPCCKSLGVNDNIGECCFEIWERRMQSPVMCFVGIVPGSNTVSGAMHYDIWRTVLRNPLVFSPVYYVFEQIPNRLFVPLFHTGHRIH